MRLFLVGAFALLSLVSAQACSAAYPARPEGPILDEAEILSPRVEDALNGRLRDYSRSSGNSLMVVSVNSLNAKAIEAFATELFNYWGIGDSQTHRGLLVLIAPNERKVRIEVGCGLEPEIPDTMAADIIQKHLK